MSLTVTLPWPPPALSPNSRPHWSEKARAARQARHDAHLACIAAGVRKLPWDRMHVNIVFHAPNWRPYDSDNALSRAKSSLDGIADATGIDDSKWTYSISRGEPVTHGAVVVTVSEDAA
ncbi:crossover junction endodeoxyribonuclease RusA [Pseudochelatococcus lubricantis]|uniref:Crossover junction endodeoxyribonuclease RusA n=1 Tax=Pseudochelatococcus lubricantis TaxID=1538102 RepID=A0ABX0UZ82_9HYPH|nr:endonuclease [Pseudochelatococcus lubricantis]NIJ57195.1 crossover junction endodeoxyribonuclease RusA [Pseudochelatococcus lubricantis]